MNAHAHMHTCRHADMQTCRHAHAHMQTCRHAHTHKHTHTHARTCLQSSDERVNFAGKNLARNKGSDKMYDQLRDEQHQDVTAVEARKERRVRCIEHSKAH